MTSRSHIKKTFAGSVFGGTVLIGALLLAGFIYTTERVTATNLGSELSISASMPVTTTNVVYLPVVRAIDSTVTNMDFENGPEVWTEYSTRGQQLILPASELPTPPHSGQWAARLGGLDNEISMISQSISIQPGNSCLTYQVWIQSSDSCDVDFGGVGVNGLWHMAESLCAGTETGRWVSRRVEMEGYVTSPLTPTIVLNLVATTDYSVASTMLIDDVVFADQSLCADSLHAFHLGEAEKQLVGRQIAGDK